MQPASEQLLADTGFAEQQHRQLGIGDYLQLAQQIADHRAVAEDFAVILNQPRLQRIRACQAQAAILVLQTGDAHRRLDHQRIALQVAARVIVEGAGMQRIERQRAPQLALDVEADAHAIVHRQRFADALVEQAVVGIGQPAIRLEPGRLTLREDGRQPRMLGDDEAPAERLLHQPDRCHRPQTVIVQAQQHHGAAAKPLMQGVHQTLQTHCIGQFGDQIGEQRFFHHGFSDPQGFCNPNREWSI
ncbi:hypothetical protein SSTU70S_03806 [Stutzerimonas stutzeri]